MLPRGIFNECFSRIIFTDVWKKQIHKPKKVLDSFLSQNRILTLKSSKIAVLSTMTIKL